MVEARREIREHRTVCGRNVTARNSILHICGDVRIQFLSEELIWVEVKNGEFCNRNTFFIPEKRKGIAGPLRV